VTADWSVQGQQATLPAPSSGAVTGEAVQKAGDLRHAFAGGATPNPRVAAGEQAVPVGLAQIRAVLRLQQQVYLFIRTYLVLDDVRRRCEDGKRFCEEGVSPESLTRMRKVVWEDIRDAMRPLPPGLEQEIRSIKDGLEAIRADVSDDQGPLYRAPDKAALGDFVRRVRHRLESVLDEIANVLGLCQDEGLKALDRLNVKVDDIFSHSDHLTSEPATAFEAQVDNRLAAAPASSFTADAMGSRIGDKSPISTS
jgi:hypothetical protein